jgi:hypothetical protein
MPGSGRGTEFATQGLTVHMAPTATRSRYAMVSCRARSAQRLAAYQVTTRRRGRQHLNAPWHGARLECDGSVWRTEAAAYIHVQLVRACADQQQRHSLGRSSSQPTAGGVEGRVRAIGACVCRSAAAASTWSQQLTAHSRQRDGRWHRGPRTCDHRVRVASVASTALQLSHVSFEVRSSRSTFAWAVEARVRAVTRKLASLRRRLYSSATAR